ncbi:MAG: FIST C-terminal domain-containing protein [Deltaproteobacteria bacterium]|jgi:hypothetical protein|nr:FIST C-terminal domain-containing protein [Deltaproteobacteria bacterium]
MPRTIIAQTSEIDEADVAMVDIMAQLDLANNLQANSVGFLFGDSSLFDRGLLPALSKRLPFDVVGINTNLTSGPNQQADYSLLTLMVLTGDDIRVATGLSGEFGPSDPDSITDLYRNVASKLENPPKLAIMFGSRQSQVFHPDRLIARLNESFGDCPIFGALGSDLDPSVDNAYMFYNGQKYMERATLVMIDGPIDPRFSFYTIPAHKFLKRKATITSCSGNIIDEINGLPAMDYLSTLGLIVDNNPAFTFNVPLVVGNPRASFWEPMLIVRQTDTGSLVCTQDVEKNSTLGLAAIDDTDVVKSAGELADELKWEAFDFCLIHSCQGRHIAMGLNYLGEIERIRSSLGGLFPYSVSYSGGEICPRVMDRNGPVNGFHTLSLTCCRF